MSLVFVSSSWRMKNVYRKNAAHTVEPSIGILLAFFFWMMIPLAIIATVWIGLGDGFDRVHLLGAYPAVAMTPVEGATSTESRAQSQIATATVASNTPRRWQRETRHTLPDQRSI